MAYASRSDAPKSSSRRSSNVGASAAEHERMNLSGAYESFSLASSSIVCQIEGTAVIQLARCPATSSQKCGAEKAPSGGRINVPPDAIVERKADMSPCTWNRGITSRVVSLPLSS